MDKRLQPSNCLLLTFPEVWFCIAVLCCTCVQHALLVIAVISFGGKVVLHANILCCWTMLVSRHVADSGG